MHRSTLRVLIVVFLLVPAASVSGKGNGKGAGDGEVFKKDRAEVAPFPREIPLGKQTEIRVRPAPSHHTPILAV
ncbi:MAG: hypothetical protein ABFS86_20400, partial [Planctomycetota bacterium]